MQDPAILLLPLALQGAQGDFGQGLQQAVHWGIFLALEEEEEDSKYM